MGGKVKESSIKISVFKDNHPSSIKQQLKEIPLVLHDKNDQQVLLNNNLKAAMLENDLKGNKPDLTFGKRSIKLT